MNPISWKETILAMLQMSREASLMGEKKLALSLINASIEASKQLRKAKA